MITERTYTAETLALAASQAHIELRNFYDVYSEWLPASDKNAIRKVIGLLANYDG